MSIMLIFPKQFWERKSQPPLFAAQIFRGPQTVCCLALLGDSKVSKQKY
jgi:hypothetical protein